MNSKHSLSRENKEQTEWLTGELRSNKPETSNDEEQPIGAVQERRNLLLQEYLIRIGNFSRRSKEQGEMGRNSGITYSRNPRTGKRQKRGADKFKTQHTL